MHRVWPAQNAALAWTRAKLASRGLAGALLISLMVIFALVAATPVRADEAAVAEDGRPAILEIDFGSAQVKASDAQEWAMAQPGQLLWPGDELAVGADSRATLVFFEGSILQVEHDTRITVVDSAASELGATRIAVFQVSGNTWSRVIKLIDAGSSYAVLTPSGVGLVRGTEFKTTVHSDGSTEIRTVEGVVELSKSQDQTGVAVEPGRAASIGPEKNDRPKEPKEFKLTLAEDEELASLRSKHHPRASRTPDDLAEPGGATDDSAYAAADADQWDDGRLSKNEFRSSATPAGAWYERGEKAAADSKGLEMPRPPKRPSADGNRHDDRGRRGRSR